MWMDTVQQQWRHVSGKRKRTSTPRPLLPNTYFREPDYGWGDFPDGNAIRCSFRGIDTTIERVFDVGTRVTYDSLVNLLLFRERERERGGKSSFESSPRLVLKHVRHAIADGEGEEGLFLLARYFFFSPLFLSFVFATISCNFVVRRRMLNARHLLFVQDRGKL